MSFKVNVTPYVVMLGAMALAFAFMWSIISGPLSANAREHRRLKHAMDADVLAALIERCDNAHGEVRVRMVETGDNVGMVNSAYCELSNEERISDTYFGRIYIDGELEYRSQFKALPRE